MGEKDSAVLAAGLPWGGPVVIRGAGDLASGVILRLARAGFRLVALETAEPLAVRRSVSFSEAVYEGSAKVEGLAARRASDPREAFEIMSAGEVAVLVDPEARSLGGLRPICLVDAIMAKRNLGTGQAMAPFVIALGPGFVAAPRRDALEGLRVDAVIETMRGHELGRVIRDGAALPDTGCPGLIDGHGKDRVFHAPQAGILRNPRAIGDTLEEGETACEIETAKARIAMRAPFKGVLRGMLREGTVLSAGLKLGDLDPRAQPGHCLTVSDKSLAIAGGVLEALMGHLSRNMLAEKGRG